MRKQVKKTDRKLIKQERKLVARCINGDKKAWDEFVDTYKGLIYNTIIRTFHFVGYRNTEEVAEDIFQDVFKSLLSNNCERLRRFKWRRGCTLASWLNIIAKNLTFDYIRKLFSHKQIMASLMKNHGYKEGIFRKEESFNQSFFEKLDHAEKVSLFERALEYLPKCDLQLVDLIYFRELPSSRVAAILGKSIDAVYMQKKRIIEKLKKIVKDML